MYDEQNIFAKIIRGELPCQKVYEDKKILAFYDIKPMAQYHIVIVPKYPYIDYADFIEHASEEEKLNFFDKTNMIAKNLNLEDFRLITNNGSGSGQEIFHFHLHLLSGPYLKGTSKF